MFAARDLLTQTADPTLEPLASLLFLLRTTYVFNTGFICLCLHTHIFTCSLFVFAVGQHYGPSSVFKVHILSFLRPVLDVEGRLRRHLCSQLTQVNDSGMRRSEVGLFLFQLAVLADETVSLHKPRTHWGPWGVRHIWANRLLMSCLHEPLIIA